MGVAQTCSGGFSMAGSRRALYAIAGVLLLILVAVVLFAARQNLLVLLIAPLALLISIGLVAIPRWILPSIALALFALVPAAYLPIPPLLGRYFSPSVICMALWVLLGLGHVRVSGKAVATIIATTIWALAATMVSTDVSYSLVWCATVFIVLLFPMFMHGDRRTLSAISTTWQVLALVLAIAAIAESLARYSPLSAAYSFRQHWSVYRVTTTLGHPLMNSVFFAVSATIVLGLLLRKRTRTRLAMSSFAGSCVAVVLTGSRSGLVALLVGLGAVVLFVAFTGLATRGSKALAAIGVGAMVVVVPMLPIVAQRAGSDEASGSSGVRAMIYDATWKIIQQSPLVGTGPGTSFIVGFATGIEYPIESAVLGSLVSVGFIGTAWLSVLVLSVVVRAVRHKKPEIVGAVAAFIVGGFAFPLWEQIPASLIILGVLSVLASRSDEHYATANGKTEKSVLSQTVAARKV
jgi:O-antigen ligase